MKYSIITPVYNREDCLARCLDSVVKQLKWNVDFEHIVVDDGSVDASAAIVRRYADNYSHLKFVQLPENKGTNAARNAAIAIATGDFCLFLDSDDYFVDEALKIIDDVVATNTFKEYVFAADDMMDEYAKNPLLNSQKTILHFHDFLSGKISSDFIHVVQTSILQKYPFSEDLKIFEFIFFLQFYRESQVILFTNIIVTIRERNRMDSVTKTVLRTTSSVIKRRLLAAITQLRLFEADYETYNMLDNINNLRKEIIEDSLMLAQYDLARKELQNFNTNFIKKRVLQIVCLLRMGWVCRLALSFFLYLKYSVLHIKMQ